MGRPHPTVDVPGRWPAVADELHRAGLTTPLAADLLAGLTGGPAVAGHVCATAFVVSPDRRRLLLVRHHRLGWSNPGGHLERHETSRAAVLRELEEETGLTTRDLTLVGDAPVAVHVTDVAGDDPHRHWNVAWLLVTSPTVPLRPEPGQDLAWFPVDDLPHDGAPDLIDTWSLVAATLAPPT
jgi:8-oxo-dGTP pyrophosphatase MutT (NUDIX family)